MISLEARFSRFMKKENDTKIVRFSIFKILSVPLLVYGEIFYLSNFGAFNFMDFQNQIYESFFSTIATFTYYIPDIFFFISGFLFANKLLCYEEEDKNKFILKSILKKFIRLYPLYFFTILIYWLISPTVTSGAVWYVYQQEAEQCNYAWWRAFLLIDNWFEKGCYSPAWFVQVEFQLVFLSSLFTFLYFKNQKIGAIGVSLFTVAMWILMFSLNAQMPV